MLLDRDRVEDDRRSGRDAQATASKLRLRIVFQSPNLEGLLLKLHPGCEQRRPAARSALTELRRVWPDYSKPPSATELRERFALADLRRAALHDDELRWLLAVLGL